MMSADTRSTHLVYGYVRAVQNALSADHRASTSIYQCIPIGIIDLCLSFFYIADCFSVCGRYIEISNESMTITHSESAMANWDTAYGALEIDCDDEDNAHAKFRWTFLVRNSSKRCVTIGIDESSRQWVNSYFHGQESKNYSLRADSGRHVCGKPSRDSRGHQSGAVQAWYDSGDTLIMELDIKAKTLTFFKVDDAEEPTLLDTISNICTENVSYCLAVYMYTNGCVTLQDVRVFQN